MSKVPLAEQIEALKWVNENVSTAVLSMAGRKLISEDEATRIVRGVDAAQRTIEILARDPDASRAFLGQILKLMRA